MDADAVAAMIAEDREQWAALCTALDARPAGPLHDPESPEWTARDVYTHIAAMMEGSTRQMEDALADRKISTPWASEGLSEDDVNARIRDRHASMSFDEARAWAQEAFERLIAVIEAVPMERWDDQIEFFARADGADHFRGHRRYIAI
jgi:hypothetical protein